MSKKIIILSSMFIFFVSLAQNSNKPELKKRNIKTQRAIFDSNKMIEVRYSFSLWNKNSEKIDSGLILLRDANSGKVLQVLLEESAPDSSLFSGVYSVNWGSSNQVKPEVYILESSDVLKEAELKKVLLQIQNKEIKRKPLLFRKNKEGAQVLEVFESNEKAKQALNIIKEQNKFAIAASSVTQKDLGIASKIYDQNELKDLLESEKLRILETQKKSLDRFRVSEIEIERIRKLQEENKKLNSELVQKNIRLSEEISESALDFYRASNFLLAEKKFKESFDLNPNNKKYYFQYGMSLYKNQKFEEAIIAFKISSTVNEFKNESIYYSGLTYYSLKEYESALMEFSKIKNNPDFNALAYFYSGLCYLEKKQFEESKAEFEKVLDISKDPKLDQKSEEYIESIINLIKFAKLREKKFFFSASMGALYDSNVLQQSDSTSDQGAATDKASPRYITGLGFYYRPIYDSNREFGIKARSDYIFTQKSELDTNDPWSVQFSTPYQFKSNWKEKPTSFSLKPGYEQLYLGQSQASGSPEQNLKSFVLDNSMNLVMSKDWITTFHLNLRKDDFVKSTEADKDAMKYQIKWSNLNIINEKKNFSLLNDFAVTLNQSQGNEYKTQRLDLSSLILRPSFFQSQFIGGLSFYYLNYPDKTNVQKDKNFTLSANFVKPITNEIQLTVLSNYSINQSNDSAYDYKRWSIGFLFSGEFGF